MDNLCTEKVTTLYYSNCFLRKSDQFTVPEQCSHYSGKVLVKFNGVLYIDIAENAKNPQQSCAY